MGNKNCSFCPLDNEVIKRRTKRLHPSKFDFPETDQRCHFQRDRDRILYSTAFRRLSEVSQVVSPNEGYLFHNRLTHALKVAQTGRRLAEKLIIEFPDLAAEYGVCPEVVEAAALGHDLGHPPFGHAGEKELCRLVDKHQDKDGFEGNPQSFRILTKLSVHRHSSPPGLNLTCATLNSILKYPWLRKNSESQRRVKQNEKWGAYLSEKDEFEFARQLCKQGSENMSVEAEIMNWADDIAYGNL